MTTCPICEKGTLKPFRQKHIMFGVDLGVYAAEKCTNCGETFTDSSVMEKIEAIAKEKGIWGLGKKTKVTRTGNSIAIRIPKEMADYLKLKEGNDVYVHPEEKKIVIELD